MPRLPGARRERRREWSAAILAALALTLLAQLVRVYVPLAFELAEDIGGNRGYVVGGGAAVVVFSAPVVAAVLGQAGRRRIALVGSMILLVGARQAIQWVHPVPGWLAAAGVVAGLAALPVVVGAVRRVAGDGGLLVGAFLGLTLDAGVRGAFILWDTAWQDGAVATAVPIGLSVLALASAATSPLERGQTMQPPSLRLALFGPFFALELLFLQNPAAVASAAELTMPAALAVVLVGDAVALATGALRRPVGPGLAGSVMVLAAAGAYLLTDVTGPRAAALVVLEQLFLMVLLTRALIAEPIRAERGPLRLAGSCALGALLFSALVLLYQIHNQVPLPFANPFVPVAAVGLVGLGAIVRRGTVPVRMPAASVFAPLALLAVPAALWATAPSLEGPTPEGGPVRIVSYNVHGTVNADGQVDPEGTAHVIEAQDPDVVVLQEVARGWPIFGAFDVAEWLSRRLEMPFVYEPAADLQLGNAILSRLPILEADGDELPFGEGPQRRSYVMVRVDVGGGRSLLVIDAHLQEAPGSDTRARQIDRLLGVWNREAPAVIAGDMNMQPDEADLRRFQDAGLLSVQDEIGDACESTAWEPKPDKPCDRPDWIFATGDLGLEDFVIVRTPASDHLPLAVTVSLGP